MPVVLYIYSKVCKLSGTQEFIEVAKSGKVLARKCKKCGELHLATVYFCQNCGNKEFENDTLEGQGSIATYTIITVPPAGFEKYTPYAWVVLSLDNSKLRVSGFMGGIVIVFNRKFHPIFRLLIFELGSVFKFFYWNF